MRIFFTLSILFLSSFLIGQVVCTPGTNGVQPTDEFPGCRMCVNLLQGSNAGYTADTDLNDACGSVENSMWLSFVADNSGEFEATFLSNSCTTNQGLELSLFDKDKNKIECFNGDGPGKISTSGLLPGQVHYIMIDGKNGDVCEFTFILEKGGTEFDPPARADEIIAEPDGDLCVGAEVCYRVEPVPGATAYQWGVPALATIIDGGEPEDQFVCVRITGSGGNVITVTPSNKCFNGGTTIKQVLAVESVPGPDITCSNTATGIEFNWNALTGADNYQVFINGSLATTTSNPTYTADDLTPGAFINIRVQAEGECSFQAAQLTCTFTVSSVEQNIINTQLQVVPNPTAGNVRVETDLKVEEIEVYSTTGAFLQRETNTIFDLKRFGAGIYFLKIKTDEGVGVKRVLVN